MVIEIRLVAEEIPVSNSAEKWVGGLARRKSGLVEHRRRNPGQTLARSAPGILINYPPRGLSNEHRAWVDGAVWKNDRPTDFRGKARLPSEDALRLMKAIC